MQKAFFHLTNIGCKLSSILLVLLVILALTAPPVALQSAEPAAKTAVVHFSKLTPFLVDVAGWTAEKAAGQTLDAAGFKMTNVERTYAKGEQSVQVRILDYSESGPLLQGLTAAWAFSSETTEGYQKGVTVDGMKGMEQFTNDGKSGHLFLLVAGRYMVEVETTGLPAADMQVWVKKFDLKKLAELK